jgi:hypothetical protein
MGMEKADLNLSPAETDPAQTNESIEIGKSESRVKKEPSYTRSRHIALKKFTPPEGEPSSPNLNSTMKPSESRGFKLTKNSS